MIKRSSRNKSQILNNPPSISQQITRRSRKYKTSVNNGIFEKAQADENFIRSLLKDILEKVFEKGEQVQRQEQKVKNCLKNLITEVIQINKEMGCFADIPKFIEDIEPIREQKIKVSSKEKKISKKISESNEELDEENESQKQIFLKFKKEFSYKSKIPKEKKQPLSLLVEKENLDEADLEIQFLKNNINIKNLKCNAGKKKKRESAQKSMRATHTVTNTKENDNYYEYNGEAAKLKNFEKRLKPVQNNDKVQDTHQLKVSRINFERLSEHLGNNRFKGKQVNTEALENYLDYTFRTRQGVTLEKNAKSNRKVPRVHLPAISKKKI